MKNKMKVTVGYVLRAVWLLFLFMAFTANNTNMFTQSILILILTELVIISHKIGGQSELEKFLGDDSRRKE